MNSNFDFVDAMDALLEREAAAKIDYLVNRLPKKYSTVDKVRIRMLAQHIHAHDVDVVEAMKMARKRVLGYPMQSVVEDMESKFWETHQSRQAKADGGRTGFNQALADFNQGVMIYPSILVKNINRVNVFTRPLAKKYSKKELRRIRDLLHEMLAGGAGQEEALERILKRVDEYPGLTYQDDYCALWGLDRSSMH